MIYLVSFIFRPHHICIAYRCSLLLQMAWRGLFLSMCVYVTGMSPAKWLNLSRCRLACGLVWARQPCIKWGSGSPQGKGQFCGWANTGMPVVGLQRGLYLATEMGTFGKGSVTWKSARRGLVLSHEDYFWFGFGASMRPFVRLLQPFACDSCRSFEHYVLSKIFRCTKWLLAYS